MRAWQIALVAGLISMIAFTSSAEAQRRLLPSLRDDESDSPVHEERKTEADSAYRNGQHDRAITLTSSVLAENPKDHVALYLRASARVERGLQTGNAQEVRSGIADARSAIGLGGADAVNYYLPYLYGMTNLAGIEQQPKHAETSLTIATQQLAREGLEPDTQANLHYQRAMTHMVLEDPASAASDYQSALRFQPTHLGAALGLPEAYLAARNEDAARTSFDSAILQFPNEPMVYNARGMFLQARGDFESAIADFTRSIEVQPAFELGYLNRGYCLVQIDNLEAADSDFSHVLAGNPQNPMALSMRATVRLQRGQAAAAAADFQTMTRLQPQDPNAFASLGFAHYVAGNYPAAIQSFQQARQLDPNGMPIIGPWLFLSLAKTQGVEAARANLKTTLPMDPQKWNWVQSVQGLLAGLIDSQALRDRIDKQNAERGAMQRTEADFFVAQRATLDGQSDTAKPLLEAVLKSNGKHLWAYRAAEYQLGVFPQ